MRVNWKSLTYQKYFLNNFAKENNFKTLDDWYSITLTKFKKQGGGSLLSLYNSNLFNILKNNYPNHKWDDLKRRSLPQRYLLTIENQRKVLDHFAKENNFKSSNDWYSIRVRDIRKSKGLSVLFRYKGLMDTLKNVYPEIEWDEILKETHTKNYWRSEENQRNFLDKLFIRLGFNKMEDYYKLNNKDIKLHGGGPLLKLYNDSFYNALVKLYPDYHWDVLKSNAKQKKKYFSNFKQLSAYFLNIQRKFSIEKKEDWFRLSSYQVRNEPGGSTICKIGIFKYLKILFPDQCWKSSFRNVQDKKSSQRWLWVNISKLFPNYLIYENYKHPNILFSSHSHIEIDIFIPACNLGFEYNGVHHYDDIPSIFPATELSKSRDDEKSFLCDKENLQLITIPYWWDQNIDSLRDHLNDWLIE